MSDDIAYSSIVSKYLATIKDYDVEFANWKKRAQKIVKRYRDEAKDPSNQSNNAVRFNILWSNVQLLMPAMFSRLPQPDVSRRFRDNDPVGRVAANLLERALEFELDHYDDFPSTINAVLMDRLLVGRGTCWVRYEPHISEQEQVSDDEAQDDGMVAGEETPQAEEIERVEKIDYEQAPVDYVAWTDFGHTVARTWEEVGCVWRIVYLSRETLEDRFGKELAEKIPLDSRPNGDERKKYSETSQKSRAKIYEIWDKEERKVYWISKAYAEVLDEKDDPLDLEDFWPCPRPFYGTVTNDSLVPVPDFVMYQDQANELDIISDRIDGLIKALKVRGVHNAAVKELQRLFTETGNNDLIPVANWPAFSDGGGLKGAMDIVDLTPIVAALQAAYDARQQCVDQIYEITGISDVMRGMNDPAATATAERLKGNFGTLRLRKSQRDMVDFATDIIRLKAQIMVTRFQPEMLAMMGGAMQMEPQDQQLLQPAMQMLGDRVLRDFRIEITSDSLVQIDEQEEQQSRMEFLGAVGSFLKEAVTAAQQTPQIAPLAMELFKYGVTGFKVGKGVEGVIDAAAEQLKQLALQHTQNPPPSPDAVKAQAQQQSDQMRGQVDMQIAQAKAQSDERLAQIKGQVDVQVAQAQQQAEQAQYAQQTQMELQKHESELRMNAELERYKAEIEERREMARMAHERALRELDAQVQLEKARIQATATVTAAEISASATVKREQVEEAREAGNE